MQHIARALETPLLGLSFWRFEMQPSMSAASQSTAATSEPSISIPADEDPRFRAQIQALKETTAEINQSYATFLLKNVG